MSALPSAGPFTTWPLSPTPARRPDPPTAPLKILFHGHISQASARAAATLCAFSAAVPHIPRHPTHSPHLSSRGTVARRAIIKVGEMPPMYTAVAGFIAPITLLYTYIIRASCPPVLGAVAALFVAVGILRRGGSH